MEYKYNFCFLLGFRFIVIVNRWFIYDKIDLNHCEIKNNSYEFCKRESQVKEKMQLFVELDLISEVSSDF